MRPANELRGTPHPNDVLALLAVGVTAADVPMCLLSAAQGMPTVCVNAAFERASGYPAAQLIGRSSPLLHAATASWHSVRALEEQLRSARGGRVRMLAHRADSSPWWSDVHVSPMADATGTVTHFFVVQLDVTEQVQAEQSAAQDALTGLANRAHFLQQLERELARADRAGTAVAVLFCDVDSLKQTNDTHGHAVGDALLVETARRLRERLRAQDLAARLGGDEFVALISDLPRDVPDPAAAVVDDLARAAGEPFHTGGSTYPMGLSIGIALYPRDGQTATALLSHADTEMYKAKRTRSA